MIFSKKSLLFVEKEAVFVELAKPISMGNFRLSMGNWNVLYINLLGEKENKKQGFFREFLHSYGELKPFLGEKTYFWG